MLRNMIIPGIRYDVQRLIGPRKIIMLKKMRKKRKKRKFSRHCYYVVHLKGEQLILSQLKWFNDLS